MLVRVCPICDKKMKYAHFCTDCKTFIKEPLFWNRTYNLNGDGEGTIIVNQCENHDHRQENVTGKVRSDYNNTAHSEASKQRKQEQKRAEKMRQIEMQRREREARQKQAERQPGSYTQQQTGKSVNKKRNVITIIVIIYIIFQVILPMLFGMISMFFAF